MPAVTTPAYPDAATTIDLARLVHTLALSTSARMPSDLSFGDWEELFSAVTFRLRVAVADGPSMTRGVDALAETRCKVLECAVALEQLHTMVKCEFKRIQEAGTKAAPAI